MSYLLTFIALSAYSAALKEESAPNVVSERISNSGNFQSSLSEVRQILFPNGTKNVHLSENSNYVVNINEDSRLLTLQESPQASKVLCQKCANLQTCRILNALFIEEIYFSSVPTMTLAGEPQQPTGTCKIIEDRGIRLDKEIFGPDKTFRDTVTCRGEESSRKFFRGFNYSPTVISFLFILILIL